MTSDITSAATRYYADVLIEGKDLETVELVEDEDAVGKLDTFDGHVPTQRVTTFSAFQKDAYEMSDFFLPAINPGYVLNDGFGGEGSTGGASMTDEEKYEQAVMAQGMKK